MPTVFGYHDVKDRDHWLASPKRDSGASTSFAADSLREEAQVARQLHPLRHLAALTAFRRRDSSMLEVMVEKVAQSERTEKLVAKRSRSSVLGRADDFVVEGLFRHPYHLVEFRELPRDARALRHLSSRGARPRRRPSGRNV